MLSSTNKPFYQHLYVQVVIAIALGVLLGLVAPSLAVQMKPLGDGFIKLIRMLIAPIVFTTVVVGVARMGDMKEVGRIGLKTILYFEAITTLALVLGLVVVNVLELFIKSAPRHVVEEHIRDLGLEGRFKV